MPRIRLLFALAQGPAWTLGIITAGTFLIDALPVRWGFIPFLALVAVTWGLAWLVRRLLAYASTHTRSATCRPGRQPYIDGFGLGIKDDALTFVFVVLASIITVIPIVKNVNMAGVIQGGDSSYHYTQLWLMERSGVASPLYANATMQGLDSQPWYYPDTWHALLSIVANGSSTAIVTANAMLVITPIIWLLSVAALAVAVADNHRVGPWAVVAAMLMPVAIVRLQLMTTLWPFVLGFAALPGLYAAIIDRARHTVFSISDWSGKALSVVPLTVLFLFPVIGLVGVHPATIVPGGFALFTVSVGMLLTWATSNFRGGRIHLATRQLAGALLLVYTMLVFVSGPGPQRFQFRRFPDVGRDAVPLKLFVSTSLYVPHSGAVADAVFVAVAVTVVASAVYLWVTSRRGIVLAWFGQWLLIIASYLPIKGLSAVTSLYFNHPRRAMVAAAIFAVPMVALAMHEAWVWLSKQPRLNTVSVAGIRSAVITAAIMALGLCNVQGIRYDAVSSFEPDETDVRYLASDAELAMIRKSENLLPENSYVLGDPAAGAGLLQVVADVPVVWPYPNSPQNPDDQYLLTYFNSIHWNGRVCEIINRHGITHFYQDTPQYYNGGYTKRLRPGLYDVDTSTGFTLIAQGGSAAIYRIDLCSTNPPTYMPSDDERLCVISGGVTRCVE
ncbi:MAG: hypothetical protein Q4P05_07185 [Actinomycetaceae bacterium]|nr:hypothetical protein [Actinomycetaceae bacterium]